MEAGNVKIPRFRKVQKKLHIFRSIEEMEKAIEEKPNYVTKWEREVNRNKDEYENRWKILE
jgi:hypothetical protein